MSDKTGYERFEEIAARFPVDEAEEIGMWMRSAGYDPTAYGEYEKWLADYHLPHAFRPVAGHPDDDECTDRADGTDATYCSLPERLHEIVTARHQSADARCTCPSQSILSDGPAIDCPVHGQQPSDSSIGGPE